MINEFSGIVFTIELFTVFIHNEWSANRSNYIHRFTSITRIVATKVDILVAFARISTAFIEDFFRETHL